MKFHTDFLSEDYCELCWFQAKIVSSVMAFFLSLAFSLTAFSIYPNIIVAVVAMALLFPLILWISKILVKKRAEKRFAAFGTSSELDLTLSEDGIYQVAASGETRLPWDDVYSVQESEGSYYVFLTKRKAFYFPKRSFDGKEHEREFLDIIKEHVPEKSIKLKAK